MSIVHGFVHKTLEKILAMWTIAVLLLFCQCSKRFAHTEHMKGFSLVWILKCLLRVDDSLKELMHNEQLWGFSPEWNLKWFFRSLRLGKDFSHWSQRKGLAAKKHTFNTMRVFNMMYINISPFRADSVLLPSDSSFTIEKQGQYNNIPLHPAQIKTIT